MGGNQWNIMKKRGKSFLRFTQLQVEILVIHSGANTGWLFGESHSCMMSFISHGERFCELVQGRYSKANQMSLLGLCFNTENFIWVYWNKNSVQLEKANNDGKSWVCLGSSILIHRQEEATASETQGKKICKNLNSDKAWIFPSKPIWWNYICQNVTPPD